MTDSTARRRGHGEDAIYFDAAKNRYVGAISVGFGPGGNGIGRRSPVCSPVLYLTLGKLS
jgi:hypothetical protein